MNMNQKTLRYVGVILLIIALFIAIAGTVIMFENRATGRSYYSWDYYGNYGYTYSYRVWKAGIMPLIGTILVLIGTICWFVAFKRPNAVVGTIVCGILGSALLYASVALLSYNHSAWDGYYLCASAASSVTVVVGLAIALFVKGRAKNGKSDEKAVSQWNASPAEKYHAYTSELMDAKSLFDAGVFSEEEYNKERANIALKYGIAFNDGSTTSKKAPVAETSAANKYDAYKKEIADAKALFDAGVFSAEQFESEKKSLAVKYGIAFEEGAKPADPLSE